MAELPLDSAGTGLPLDPYGGRGCCGYGDGPVLQHRPDQFLDDERRTLPGHHPQVLELFGSGARKWCVPCPLRDSLLDRGERRLYPGRTHWGVGFRTCTATCEPSASDPRFPRGGKSGTLKLPTGIKTMNAIEVVQRYNKACNGRDAPSELER
jgi:hypothetical protein